MERILLKDLDGLLFPMIHTVGVGIIDIGNISSQEVKANLGIELKEDERTNEENYDEYIADNIFLVL
jgi:hypothetical protein